MSFKSLIGQDTVKRLLLTSADRAQLPNSFLFYGPEGVGKWVAALALTAYLNCRHHVENDSCGVCGSCKQIRKLQHPNLYIAVPTPPSKKEKEEYDNYWGILNAKIAEPYSLIEGRRQMTIPVAAVRRIRQSLSQKPSVDGTRVVVIEQMDRMLGTSADALLKIVEEPPSRTLIIITSSRSERLQPTIISRCRQVRFAHLTKEVMVPYLVEKTSVNQKTAEVLARLSGGSLGRALYLSDDDNTQNREIAKLIFKNIFQSDVSSVIAEAVDLLPLNDRFKLNRIIASWQSLFRDMILLQSGADVQALMNIDYTAELERLSGVGMNQQGLSQLPARIGSVIEDIDLNVDTRSAIAALILDIRKQLEL